MKILLTCDNIDTADTLYTMLVNDGAPSEIEVRKKVVTIITDEDEFCGQKILVNNIKQFMRDRSLNYKMEIV